MAFGLAATCCVFLWFHYHNHPNYVNRNANNYDDDNINNDNNNNNSNFNNNNNNDDNNSNYDSSFILGLSYILNLNNSNIIVMTDDIILVLKKLLNNTENDIIPSPQPFVPNPRGATTTSKEPVEDDILFELRIHPYTINSTVLKRLSFLRFSRAIFTSINQSLMISNYVINENNKDILQKCFILLFQCLSCTWEDIGGWALKSLHLLIRMKSSSFVTLKVYEKIFPR